MLHLFKENQSLKKHTTLGVEATARYFLLVTDIQMMREVLQFCSQKSMPYCILGKGSNVLFEETFNGLVIVNQINFCHFESPAKWHVGAGHSFSLLGSKTAKKGLTGLEFAAGIPGSVGGAVYMNAGANGSETCQTLLSVDFVHETGLYEVIDRSALQFSYRKSSFQSLKGAIVGATFQLEPGIDPKQTVHTFVYQRKKTQPYQAKSAGCIFRNPLPHSAGKLIDQSGLKGMSIGGAQISTLHGNFIINTGTASTEDIKKMIAHIQTTIFALHGIQLESEICLISSDPKQTTKEHE